MTNRVGKHFLHLPSSMVWQRFTCLVFEGCIAFSYLICCPEQAQSSLTDLLPRQCVPSLYTCFRFVLPTYNTLSNVVRFLLAHILPAEPLVIAPLVSTVLAASPKVVSVC